MDFFYFFLDKSVQVCIVVSINLLCLGTPLGTDKSEHCGQIDNLFCCSGGNPHRALSGDFCSAEQDKRDFKGSLDLLDYDNCVHYRRFGRLPRFPIFF